MKTVCGLMHVEPASRSCVTLGPSYAPLRFYCAAGKQSSSWRQADVLVRWPRRLERALPVHVDILSRETFFCSVVNSNILAIETSFTRFMLPPHCLRLSSRMDLPLNSGLLPSSLQRSLHTPHRVSFWPEAGSFGNCENRRHVGTPRRISLQRSPLAIHHSLSGLLL